MPGALLATWACNNTNRSVLAVIILHLMGNLSGQILQPSSQVRLLDHGVRVVLVFVIIWLWGPVSMTEYRSDGGAGRDS